MLHKIKFQIMFIMRHYNGEQKKTKPPKNGVSRCTAAICKGRIL